ncbi:hypothetical protein BV898_16852 [Hypsibius exemplaris]|uniref:Tudor domain-containing protein n=1 Tax=Hypsibius exemplaris TaxID=2072580 RepID=A0A9X6NGU7_HYPEX|nr:hypothetical protein BV898_16852 [Hypsibius exemplaris]
MLLLERTICLTAPAFLLFLWCLSPDRLRGMRRGGGGDAFTTVERAIPAVMAEQATADSTTTSTSTTASNAGGARSHFTVRTTPDKGKDLSSSSGMSLVGPRTVMEMRPKNGTSDRGGVFGQGVATCQPTGRPRFGKDRAVQPPPTEGTSRTPKAGRWNNVATPAVRAPTFNSSASYTAAPVRTSTCHTVKTTPSSESVTPSRPVPSFFRRYFAANPRIQRSQSVFGDSSLVSSSWETTDLTEGEDYSDSSPRERSSTTPLPASYLTKGSSASSRSGSPESSLTAKTPLKVNSVSPSKVPDLVVPEAIIQTPLKVNSVSPSKVPDLVVPEAIIQQPSSDLKLQLVATAPKFIPTKSRSISSHPISSPPAVDLKTLPATASQFVPIIESAATVANTVKSPRPLSIDSRLLFAAAAPEFLPRPKTQPVTPVPAQTADSFTSVLLDSSYPDTGMSYCFRNASSADAEMQTDPPVTAEDWSWYPWWGSSLKYPADLVKGEALHVYVTALVDPKHLFLIRDKDGSFSPQLDGMSREMAEFAENGRLQKFVDVPPVDAVVCAWDAQFDQWSRGIIVDRYEGKALVFYLDYGTCAVVKLEKIRQMKFSWFSVPRKAFCAELDDMSLPADGYFSQDTLLAAQTLLMGQKFGCFFVIADVRPGEFAGKLYVAMDGGQAARESVVDLLRRQAILVE